MLPFYFVMETYFYRVAGDGFLPGICEGKKTIPRQPLGRCNKGETLKVSGFPSSSPFLAIGEEIKSGGYSMNNKSEKRYYSPQFSEVASVSVRRLAWALGMPMTETIDYVVKNLPFTNLTEPLQVCTSCKDKTRCKVCSFRNPISEQEAAELLAAM
jgi:hypothetical protein